MPKTVISMLFVDVSIEILMDEDQPTLYHFTFLVQPAGSSMFAIFRKKAGKSS